jgi:aminoglycoside phosphotransferase (APT) family kinase protein
VASGDRLDGLDLAALDQYLRSIGIDRDGELRAQLISGGRSNLTFLVYDDASKWVLRRPPLHGLTPSAHDMAREYKVVAALQDTKVPVARAISMFDDDSVLGAPFQIVEYVAGQVVRRRDEFEALGDKTVIEGCVDALIQVLVDLHTVDPNAIGLSDFGKPSGYGEPAVGARAAARRRPDTAVQRLHSALRRFIP